VSNSINTYNVSLIIENTGKFNEARKQLFQKGMKANFKLYRDMKSTDPSIKTFFTHF
jgi:adenine-specific DNA methylase